jgi:hypothetical protein
LPLVREKGTFNIVAEPYSEKFVKTMLARRLGYLHFS